MIEYNIIIKCITVLSICGNKVSLFSIITYLLKMTRILLIDKLYNYVLYILNVNNTVRFGLLLINQR